VSLLLDALRQAEKNKVQTPKSPAPEASLSVEHGIEEQGKGTAITVDLSSEKPARQSLLHGPTNLHPSGDPEGEGGADLRSAALRESVSPLSLITQDTPVVAADEWVDIALLSEFDLSPAQSSPPQEIEDAGTAEFTPEVQEESLSLALGTGQAPLQVDAKAAVDNVFVGADKAIPTEPQVDSNSPTTPQIPPPQTVQPTSNRQLAEDLLLAAKAPVKNRMPLILLGALAGLVAVAGYLYSLSLPPTPVYSATPDPGTQSPAPEIAPEPAIAVAETPGDAASSAVMPEPKQDSLIDNTPTVPVAPPVQAPQSDPKPVAARITPAPPVQKNLNNGIDTFIVESPDPIIIKVHQQPPHAAANLNAAYQLYQQQDYVGAAGYYRQVLTEAPNNIDALLGMGSVAEQLGDKATAEPYYKKVQALDNGNVYAGNALVRLEQSQFPADKESGYKALLDKSPDAAQTHAELGNLYAGQERWNDAQQAYFNAVDKAPGNAEYAYNLAISLDHLGKTAIAKRYYQQALQLAKIRPASFDTASVYLRLQQLSEQ
jgi:thioredoxin-like negative regulator of GroEL